MSVKSYLIKKGHEQVRFIQDPTKIRVFCKKCSKYSKGRNHVFRSVASYSHHLLKEHKEGIDREYVESEFAKLQEIRQGVIA
jgi:hypothetical protein